MHFFQFLCRQRGPAQNFLSVRSSVRKSCAKIFAHAKLMHAKNAHAKNEGKFLKTIFDVQNFHAQTSHARF